VQREKLETYVDEELLRGLRERARTEGREDHEVLEEALSDYLSRASATPLTDLMERVKRRVERGEAPRLSEEEALALAVEEQHASRSGR
jgi:hypothetical protein